MWYYVKCLEEFSTLPQDSCHYQPGTRSCQNNKICLLGVLTGIHYIFRFRCFIDTVLNELFIIISASIDIRLTNLLFSTSSF